MTTIPSTTNVPSTTRRSGRRVLRGIGRTLAALFGLIVVLGLVGAIYESAAEAADVRAYPPPGQMVNVGGYRLHINCTGAGSPTVVIDAGWGDWSASWSSSVQPDVAKTTRVCTYDRAGMGGVRPIRYRALPSNSRKNCTRCCRTLASQARMCWSDTQWAV